MIRLFNAYFPTRTLLLTVTEALLVTLGFVVAVVFWAPLNHGGYGWIVPMTFVGVGLGILGLCYAQVRRSRPARQP